MVYSTRHTTSPASLLHFRTLNRCPTPGMFFCLNEVGEREQCSWGEECHCLPLVMVIISCSSLFCRTHHQNGMFVEFSFLLFRAYIHGKLKCMSNRRPHLGMHTGDGSRPSLCPRDAVWDTPAKMRNIPVTESEHGRLQNSAPGWCGREVWERTHTHEWNRPRRTNERNTHECFCGGKCSRNTQSSGREWWGVCLMSHTRHLKTEYTE